MAEETWEHMQIVQGNTEGGATTAEWFECTCGLVGVKRDPHDSTSWDALWEDVLDHLREVGQVIDPYSDAKPFDGYSGPIPQNLMWPFRSDVAVEERRAAREYYQIPAPPSA